MHRSVITAMLPLFFLLAQTVPESLHAQASQTADVNVKNFPETQQIRGEVRVNNFPDTQ